MNIGFQRGDDGYAMVRKGETHYLLAGDQDDMRMVKKLRSTIDAKMASLPKFCGSVWEAEPNCTRMVDGVAGRMERYEATGNGQIPIVAAAALWTLANS